MSGFDIELLVWLVPVLVGIGAWWENEKRKQETRELHGLVQKLSEQLEIERSRVENIRKYIARKKDGEFL